MSASGTNYPLRPVPPGRYVDFEKVGEGAMGRVYLALDTELNRSVAFKIVRPEGPGMPVHGVPPTPLEASAPPHAGSFRELSARFLREARVTGAMEHPGIVPVYEIGRTDGGVPYYTMRFVRGQRTLATALEELGNAAFEERLVALEAFLKLCDAVSYAHDRGVIHRDIKPANVALGEFGEVVLLDWGLAKQVHGESVEPDARPTTTSGPQEFQTDVHKIGTPGYMPPEAFEEGSEHLDERGDVYSLGVILFHVLTGRIPFPPLPFPDYYEALRSEEAPRAKSLDPTVPDALDGLCARSLGRDRDTRLPSVRALSDGIRKWQTQSARAREMDRLLREAHGALAAAQDSKGPSRIRQTQRALSLLEAARAHKPDSARVEALRAKARELRNQGIQETQRRGRQRLVLIGGGCLLACSLVTAILVAGAIDRRREEAERANRSTVAALAVAQTQREEAARQARAAEEATRQALRDADRARGATEFVHALVEGMRAEDVERVLTQDAGFVFGLLEQARGDHLLSRLAVGAAMRSSDPPPALLEAAESARQRSNAAGRAWQEARTRRLPILTLRPASRRLGQARQAYTRSLETLLRAGAGDLPARTDTTPTVEQIQASLVSGDAFLSYGRLKDLLVAVVIRPEGGQAIPLGKMSVVEAAVSEMRRAFDGETPTDASVAALRQAIIEPLRAALPPPGGRVYVAPHGAMFLVPFGLLLPENEVHTVPSARACLFLRGLAPRESAGVLGMAGPLESGAAKLPQDAQAEALAVGTTPLLGPDATRRRLAEALTRPLAWRGIHLGLPGRLASEEREGAHLVASPEGTDDGYLSALEIALMDVRADLAVLAAASPPRSSDPSGDGALELPQALLFAGVRSVLFSVGSRVGDEDATGALMVKFHELWEGPARMSTAAALAGAQAHVRAQPNWQHPRYWAAWVLWDAPR